MLTRYGLVANLQRLSALIVVHQDGLTKHLVFVAGQPCWTFRVAGLRGAPMKAFTRAALSSAAKEGYDAC